MMKLLQHPNIVEMFGYGQEKNDYYIVMELMNDGNLYDGNLQEI